MYKHAYVSVLILGFKKKILTLGISDPGTVFDIFIFLTKVFWFGKKKKKTVLKVWLQFLNF